MAINLIGGNLNQYGNSGQFESDISTWGFTIDHLSRSSEEKSAGLYSAKVFCFTDFAANGPDFLINIGRASLSANQTYLVRIKVKTSSTSPIANGDCIISIDSPTAGITVDLQTTKTVTEATDVFIQLELRVTTDSIIFPSTGYFNVYIRKSAPSDDLIYAGSIYCDEFEIYQYEEVEDPDTCTLQIDEEESVVTDETSPGESDGIIEVEVTGAVNPVEYSINGGSSWQSSNQFTGLAGGTYTVIARETITLCTDSYAFVVANGAADFDFTFVTVDETISGSNNGSIEITTSGTGAPFTYSITGGSSFQSSNIFVGLAPGTYYLVVKDNTGIIVSKTAVVAPGVVVFDKIFFNRNPITETHTAAPDWQSEDDYRLFIDIRVQDDANGGTYNSKLKYPLVPSASNNAEFYLNEAFRGSLKAIPPLVNASTIIRLTDRIKYFKTFIGSITADEVEASSYVESLPNLVVLGGVSKIKFPGLNYFTSYLTANKKFLTWAPPEKQVGQNQEDYLNFFSYSFLITQLKLQGKAYYSDGTTTTVVLKTLSGIGYGQLYQIPAGTSNSGITFVTPEKLLVRYELTLLNQSDVAVSETRSYVVDVVSNSRTRYFMFLNSLGSYEVLRFNGQAEPTTDYERGVMQKFLPANYESIDGEFESLNVTLQEKNNFSSGFITGRYAAQWQEYLKDLYLSKKVFDVTSGERIPVRISNTSYKAGDDQDYLRFARIDTQRSYRDENFTPDLI